jgi:prevent-host-death family protein
MKTISIKELHERTGHWLRRVAEEREVVVTERGVPVARMLPPARHPGKSLFARRKLLPGAAQLIERPIGGPDSAEIISAMRDDR